MHLTCANNDATQPATQSPLAVLDSSSLPANTPVNVTLPATCLGPTANHLRIRPDWMGEAHVK